MQETRMVDSISTRSSLSILPLTKGGRNGTLASEALALEECTIVAPLQERVICDDPEELYLFGGNPVALGGDFAQIPPVVQRGSRADTVSVSVRQSFLWSSLRLFRLTHSMRLTSLQNENDIAFARFLADMSYNSSLQGSIVLSSFICQTTQLAEFITSCNDTVDNINMTVFEKMPGEKVTLFSTDTADSNDADDLHAIPAKYLQSLNSSGLPPSQLELKVDAPVMLLRNIDPASGLCNGTRLIVVHIGQYLLRVRLAHKPNTPNETIPRFTLSSQEGDMPFIM
ncbi:hypothetical protein G6F71_004978 [Rhizopus microsporus]|nr:hypothetical protein G6F71_004978 [Rhizopus microsporus]KAG1233031.1 hypothetical protein G6F67_004578 [Rhizopus microsporus]